MEEAVIRIGLFVAIILGIYAEFVTSGRDVLGWAIIIGFGVLLYGRL